MALPGTALPRNGTWLTRAVFLRSLGAVYAVAFLSLALQLRPLIGSDGLLPARQHLSAVAAAAGSWGAFRALPGLFWVGASDGFLLAMAWSGLALAVVVAAGFANVLALAGLWFLYLSFVHVGQAFYGFGWELLLLETGFLAIFLCPLIRGSAFRAETPPPVIVLWLLRWVLFRLMFGAGLIKLRGDACWRDLTCLVFHYETQPIPNPLSWLLHQSPGWLHSLGVLWNHLIELVVPWGLLAPWRRVRTIAGLLTATFQVTLILSGNLSFLNYLTLVLCLACFDDGVLGRLVPARFRERAAELTAATAERKAPRAQRIAVTTLALLVAALSIRPVLNLLSSNQAMNASYDPLKLVNSYGMFGSVGRVRNEIVLEGTHDNPALPGARWQPYAFRYKPGDPNRRPPLVAPHQPRLDWHIWFAAMSNPGRHPWFLHLVYKLLQGNGGALGLLAPGPFEHQPPRAIRAELYEYRFTGWNDPGDAWWERKRIGQYLPPLTLEDPALIEFLQRRGWF